MNNRYYAKDLSIHKSYEETNERNIELEDNAFNYIKAELFSGRGIACDRLPLNMMNFYDSKFYAIRINSINDITAFNYIRGFELERGKTYIVKEDYDFDDGIRVLGTIEEFREQFEETVAAIIKSSGL